ncbi:response regulator transcription factor [Clostridium thermarum]|uniref:response regulator transcription factor n=1 Tax=Clostridium thermarum TaxID=1716543 RepID=UPI001123A732|nr:response regulator [Clostridium thermarum]
MCKLIIVDDEPNVISGIKSVIDWECNGIDVCATANNGQDALDIIRRVHPDIALMDIKMPNMTGLELLQVINENGLKVKVIFLSGYDDFDYARLALRYGACDYLLKPCMPEEILKAVLNAKEIVEKDKRIEFAVIRDRNLIESSVSSASKNINVVLKTALDYIHENYSKDLNLKLVADKVFITSGYLSLLFKKELDINFVDYLNKYRIEMSKKLLADLKYKTYEVAYKVGFKDEKYFSQIFKKCTNLTPREFRNSMQ